MEYAIEAEGLVKRFGTTLALAGVDFAVRRGSVLGMLGPNGAGKTTAVRILATLLAADAGTARIHGYDVATQAADVRRTVGLTGQYASVDEALTGRQNLVMIGQLLDLTARSPRPAQRAARLVRPGDAGDRPARTYSGGMRRRLDLAASLVGRPSVVFLDEPTTGLDPSKREDMWGIVRGLGRRHRPAHDAISRRGRRAGRRHRGDRPRPGHRPRHARRTQARRRQSDADGPPRGPCAARATARILEAVAGSAPSDSAPGA